MQITASALVRPNGYFAKLHNEAISDMIGKRSNSSRVSTRIFWALSILFSSFVALLALSIPDSDAWQENFLHVVLLLVVLTNVGVNVLQVRRHFCGYPEFPNTCNSNRDFTAGRAFWRLRPLPAVLRGVRHDGPGHGRRPSRRGGHRPRHSRRATQ